MTGVYNKAGVSLPQALPLTERPPLGEIQNDQILSTQHGWETFGAGCLIGRAGSHIDDIFR